MKPATHASILLLGAGRSATVLIQYLIEQAALFNWSLTIADVSVAHVAHLGNQKNIRVAALDINQEETLENAIGAVDVVISLLPVAFHGLVANKCLQLRRHFITASYVTPEIAALNDAAIKAGLIFIMEAGLDPGIDHMSAMGILHKIKAAGGEITSFKSYTGGLVAPESDTNPWHYKFTWNPRNVVLAGQGTAKYLQNNTYKYIPYHQIFRRTEALQILNLDAFDGYANRDSLQYREPYGLQNIPTLVRGTLRRRGYCQAWHLLVQLGLTDDSYVVESSYSMTYRQFLEAYLPPAPARNPWPERVAHYLKIPHSANEIKLLAWLEFPEEAIALERATPAQILEKLLLQKWQLAPQDKDMVLMQHLFEYTLNGEYTKLTSTLVVLGEDSTRTAMAKTVGLPVGITAKLVLQKQISQRGVIIPIEPEIYQPVLQELDSFGITFLDEIHAEKK